MITSTLPIPAIRKRQHGANPCKHEHTIVTLTGTVRYYAGEIYDACEDRIICTDCGATLKTPDVFPDKNSVAPKSKRDAYLEAK